MIFLDNLINGLSLGSIYAIIALGYTMVYGIAKMLNFAHGDVIMVGAYMIYTTCTLTWNTGSMPIWLGKAEIDVFLEFSCFFYDPVYVGKLISVSSPFSKSTLNIWNFMVHVLMKPCLQKFEHCFANV